ncbi:hypothetical protein H4R33_005923, partial [Dimargaris cristalligena]
MNNQYTDSLNGELTAKEIWKTMVNRFTKLLMAKVLTLYSELYRIHQGNQSIHQLAMKIQSFDAELKKYNLTSDQQLTLLFLQAVDEIFHPTVSQWHTWDLDSFVFDSVVQSFIKAEQFLANQEATPKSMFESTMTVKTNPGKFK